MDNQVRALGDRILKIRGQEGIVYDQKQSVLRRQTAHFRQIGHLHRRVARCLNVECLRLIRDRLLNRLHIGCIYIGK